jgi:hypothetical protein
MVIEPESLRGGEEFRRVIDWGSYDLTVARIRTSQAYPKLDRKADAGIAPKDVESRH